MPLLIAGSRVDCCGLFQLAGAENFEVITCNLLMLSRWHQVHVTPRNSWDISETLDEYWTVEVTDYFTQTEEDWYGLEKRMSKFSPITGAKDWLLDEIVGVLE